jgi:hypothetical protein
MMCRKTISLIVALLFSAAGCSLLGGGLSVGDTAQGDLNDAVEIEELLPNSEEVLLAVGIAVEDDWPAIEYQLKSGEGLSLFVEEDDIDPVLVVVDGDNEVIAAGDDWEDELDAFVSIEEVPDGARVIVFDISGEEGEFLLEVKEADDYRWTLEADEEYELSIIGDKENDKWDELLGDIEQLYNDRNWESCRVVPLKITGAKWLSIRVESDDDLVMVILLADGDDLEYIDYDDDTYGVSPAFSNTLESGNYVVVIDTYNGSDNADFQLSIEEFDPDDMVIEAVDAEHMDEWYSAEFSEGAVVMNYWPQSGDYYGVLPDEPVVVFEFEIEEEGEYTFDVFCDDDTKMAIIDNENVMIDYNDDDPDGGLNPQLSLQLEPGLYSALVAPYDQASSEPVDFRYTVSAAIERERGLVPMDDTFNMHSNVYMSIVFEPGNSYEIFAESNIDLKLTVTDTTGEEYFSDDEGGDFNPYLLIECTRGNAGEWQIDLESYSGTTEDGEVHFVARPVEHHTPDAASTSVEPIK